MTRPLPGDLDAVGWPPPWLGHTPSATQLEQWPLDWFHQAIDQLQAETVPKSYWDRVIASMAKRQERAR